MKKRQTRCGGVGIGCQWHSVGVDGKLNDLGAKLPSFAFDTNCATLFCTNLQLVVAVSLHRWNGGLCLSILSKASDPRFHFISTISECRQTIALFFDCKLRGALHNMNAYLARRRPQFMAALESEPGQEVLFLYHPKKSSSRFQLRVYVPSSIHP